MKASFVLTFRCRNIHFPIAIGKGIAHISTPQLTTKSTLHYFKFNAVQLLIRLYFEIKSMMNK